MTGGLVIACNHFHWVDPPALGSACPRTIYYMAKVEAHRVPGLGSFIRAFGTFPVRRGESDRDAVRTMRAIVRDGLALGLFVEGTRQKGGVPGEIQPGAAMVAIQEDVPVIPVALHGSQTWKPGNFHPLSVAWGEPIRFDRAAERWQGLQGGVVSAADEDPQALRLPRRDACSRSPGRCTARMSDVEIPEEVEVPREIAGTVAIVGFPNVGKSTLINRLTQSRAAVVHETPGVTRDRKELLCEWTGTWFRLIDTGGVDEADGGPFGSKIAEQALAAIDESDLVLFVVDARAGITPGDEELAVILRARQAARPRAREQDRRPSRDSESAVFHRLGLGDPWPLSGLHGHGTGDLLDEIVSRLPGTSEVAIGTEAIRVAILGRPNVGKSSLLNRIVGRERVIVSEVPGTTRDSIDTVLQRGETTFVLVDTAGLRRRRKQRQGIEYYSELRALQAAERADVAWSCSTPPRGSSSRIWPSPTSRARRGARRLPCFRNGM